MREDVQAALVGMAGNDFKAAAQDLLAVLGYRSERTLPGQTGAVADFIAQFPAAKESTRTEQTFREHVQSVRLVFQVTGDEIVSFDQPRLGFKADSFDEGQQQSFMFFAVELKEETYARGQYAQFTREINKRLSQPTVVLFSTADHRLTLSFVHRREHKRDRRRDVLGRVSLIREIVPADPHRAHLDILAELSLAKCASWMDLNNRPHNFNGLLAAWLEKLDTEELNRKFYRELFDWFERAVEDARFPTTATITAEQQVIRLITRILFVWFIKEKRLVSEEWFVQAEIEKLLSNFGGSDYYRAVLQNLFFATLNTEMDSRGFSTRREPSHRVFSRYRYKSLIRDLERFEGWMKQTPFINGGLFDCLDDEESRSEGGKRIDMFSDPDPKDGPHAAQARRDAWRELNVPDALFFDQEYGLFPLLNHYKFTVEENTPVEQEVALDPELLGKVFENLLAAYNPETQSTARKQTGSYYTPRVVVDYMVDEALVATLKQKCLPKNGNAEDWDTSLHWLLNYAVEFNDVDVLFDDAAKESIVRAIADLKVLDPAVGSGAFPMGILHKLTLALKRLDPGNERWEALQKEGAIERAKSAFDSKEKQVRNRQLLEISETFQRYSGDFGRKLYLIQNSIFGVDIQPVACQIAKLRFFISLAIEQEPKQNVKNFGFKPLPNLETRFVAANTLIGLKGDPLLKSRRAQELERELNQNREHHFHTTTRLEKLECKGTDRMLRRELATELENLGLPTDAAQSIARWDPYDQNTTADWFDAGYMFNAVTGFDVVIGNPPYVESRNNLLSNELKNTYGNQVLKDWDESLPRGSDLLIYFYTRSPKFLNGSGVGCFITQNAWLNTDYGLRFQNFSLGKLSFQKITDTSAKFFSDTNSQNINAVITTFTKTGSQNIVYEVVDSDMDVTTTRTLKPEQDMKWGHIISMPQYYSEILSRMLQDSGTGKAVKFGQGINPSRGDLKSPGYGLPIIDKDVQFVVESATRSVEEWNVSSGRRKKIPALVLPRGIGDRHYCIFNLCRALSYSHVETYLPSALWESDFHYCLWAYLNSSFVWLFREITGRKNLGGGLLKAEATDMKALPVGFSFDFANDAKQVFESIRSREPLAVREEVYTEEHLAIDDMVARYFGFSNRQQDIRDALLEHVNSRHSKARPKR